MRGEQKATMKIFQYVEQRLSTRLSWTVLDSGISENQLVYRGFGKRNALVPSDASNAERRGDRKVVLEVVTDDLFWNFLKSK